MFDSYIENCLLNSQSFATIVAEPLTARSLTVEHEVRTSLCDEQNKYGFGT